MISINFEQGRTKYHAFIFRLVNKYYIYILQPDIDLELKLHNFQRNLFFHFLLRIVYWGHSQHFIFIEIFLQRVSAKRHEKEHYPQEEKWERRECKR